jgi:hypothetical protein
MALAMQLQGIMMGESVTDTELFVLLQGLGWWKQKCTPHGAVLADAAEETLDL